MGEPEELLLFGIVAVVVICLERIIARRLLSPCSRAVSWVADKVFKPFAWLQQHLTNGMHHVRSRHLGRMKWIQKIDALDDRAALRPFGGLWKILFMVFCLLFTVVTFFVCLVVQEGTSLSEDIVLNLPIFALFEIMMEEPFAYEALLQLALLSVLSVEFMERNAKTTDGAVTAVYDLIFTGFCTCFLYIIPSVVYRLPVTLVTWCRSFTAACSEIPVVNVLVWIVAIPLFVIVGYVIASTYLLALRELLESLTYSLIPLTLFFLSLVLLQEMDIGHNLMMFLCFALLLLLCWAVGFLRVNGKKKSEKDACTPPNRRFRLFRRR